MTSGGTPLGRRAARWVGGLRPAGLRRNAPAHPDSPPGGQDLDPAASVPANSSVRPSSPSVSEVWGDFGGLPSPDRLGRHTAQQLAEAFDRLGVEFRVDPRLPSMIAVRFTDRQQVRAALIGDDAPRVITRVGVHRSGHDTVRRNIGDLSVDDVDTADRLDVGTPFKWFDYRVTTKGYATIVFIEWDAHRERMLSVNPRSKIVDWTASFDNRQDGPSLLPLGFSEPVDVVYTWVDPSDPAWRATLDSCASSSEAELPSSRNADRFVDRDELQHSLRSLEMFAPFVRRVFLVTASQVPAWLVDDHPRLTVVDHHEIFPDSDVLPVFNSHSIEACLHRIDGLAEHFLYLNDDVVFGNTVVADDFFSLGGLPKIRLSPSQVVYDNRPVDDAIPTDFASFNVQRLVERDTGVPVRHRVKHVPHPLRRSVLAELEASYPAEFAATRAARFRSRDDLAVASMLAPWHSIATGRAVEWPNIVNEYVYADTGRADWPERARDIVERRPKFFCVNATRLDEIPLEQQARNVGDFLERLLPFPSSFERQSDDERRRC